MRDIATIVVILLISLLVSTICFGSNFDSFIPDSPRKVNLLANAIYKAENSKKFPYGIKSVPCNGELKCREICKNTIINNIKRWKKSGKSTYLEFLANRYAPVGVSNDPSGLNEHWLKNVKFFLNKELK